MRVPARARRAALLLATLSLVALAVWWWGVREAATPLLASGPVADPAAQVAHGAVLARAGNCLACHTARGGAPFAGGRAVQTPFGAVWAGNLTPEPDTGLGRWSADDFWRALHWGKSRDGRLLVPAFPYTHFTRVSRADSDALFAYLRSLPPVHQARPEHSLRWPLGTQPALAVWRALYFRPGALPPEPTRSAEWNRGAYLVHGLAHCGSCHGSRDALGGQRAGGDLAGGLLPQHTWYAPSLYDPAEAGLGGWPVTDIVALLRDGISARGSTRGPMGDVVRLGTSHLPEADLRAMAVYLQAPGGSTAPAPAAALAGLAPHPPVEPTVAANGARLYERHCADCHGTSGQGHPGAWPALAGNRAVTLPAATPNLVQTVLYGGYLPATAGNPQPHGMPPFILTLSDAEIAAVLTHLRTQWGNQGPPVTTLQVHQVRAGAPAH